MWQSHLYPKSWKEAFNWQQFAADATIFSAAHVELHNSISANKCQLLPLFTKATFKNNNG